MKHSVRRDSGLGKPAHSPPITSALSTGPLLTGCRSRSNSQGRQNSCAHLSRGSVKIAEGSVARRFAAGHLCVVRNSADALRAFVVAPLFLGQRLMRVPLLRSAPPDVVLCLKFWDETMFSQKEAHPTLPPPQVTVLLCTYNGAQFLHEQLASISKQTHQNWRLVISDDGSHDNSLEIVEKAFPDQSRVETRQGPQQGSTKNFMSLITDGHIGGDCFAYCDQDDIWAQDKLERAVSFLGTVSPGTPALYCSKVRIIASDGRHKGFSPNRKRAPSFCNALVENIAGGNTMVMNKAARNLLIAASVRDVVVHDWWTYILVSGAGGSIHYDHIPSVDYRQHPDNLIGASIGVTASLKRIRSVIERKFSSANTIHSDALRHCRYLLSPQSRSVLDAFFAIRRGSAWQRIQSLRRAKLWRQTRGGQLSLIISVALGLA